MKKPIKLIIQRSSEAIDFPGFVEDILKYEAVVGPEDVFGLNIRNPQMVIASGVL